MIALATLDLLSLDDFALETMTKEESRDVYQLFLERVELADALELRLHRREVRGERARDRQIVEARRQRLAIPLGGHGFARVTQEHPSPIATRPTGAGFMGRRWSVDKEISMAPGDSVRVEEYELTYRRRSFASGPNSGMLITPRPTARLLEQGP